MGKTLTSLAPLISAIIAFAALWLGVYNFRYHLRASLSAYWSLSTTPQRYLTLKNFGPGTATIYRLKRQNTAESPEEDFQYLEDRVEFPFELGSGASYEFQIKSDEQPQNIRVVWTDGRLLQQSRRIPVSSMRSTPITGR